MAMYRLIATAGRIVAAAALWALASSHAAGEAATDTAALLLREGFEAGMFTREGGLFYKDNPEQRDGGVTFQSRNVRSGAGALTLSVKSSCLPPSDDCSERAEVWETPEVLVPYDRTVWYGFAVFLDDPIPQDDRRYVLAQWKREIIPGAQGDYSPFLALRLYQGRLGITVETDLVEAFRVGSAQRPQGCLPGEARVLNRANARQTRALVAVEAGTAPSNYPDYFDSCAPGIRVTRHADLPPAQNGWIDLVFRSSPDPGGKGRIEVLADGVHIVTVTGAIGHAGPGLDHNQYFKFGPYRAANPQPWSVTFDDFRRGPRCVDVIRVGQCPAE